MAEDYYALLGISRGASADEIQKAYRKLARKYHPDLHADKSDREKKTAKEKFQQIQRAYDVLNDSQKRELYDRYGANFDAMGGSGGQGNPFGGAGPGGSPFGDIDISQLFGGGGKKSGGMEDIFRQFGMRGGAPPQPPGPRRGEDIEQEITVSFHTAIKGGEHQITFQRHKSKTETIAVKIPPGIENKKKIRLRGQGGRGMDGGDKGDLLIKVNVASHPVYTRTGMNLSVALPINLIEAIEGAKIDVPTPHGTVAVTVPPGSTNGKTLRLKGLGVKSAKASGDLLVKLQIQLPDEIPPTDLELLKQLSAHWSDENIRDELTW